MFSGHSLKHVHGRNGPRQEVVEAAVWVAGDDPSDYICEVDLRLDAIKLAGRDQGGDDGPVLGAAVRSGE